MMVEELKPILTFFKKAKVAWAYGETYIIDQENEVIALFTEPSHFTLNTAYPHFEYTQRIKKKVPMYCSAHEIDRDSIFEFIKNHNSNQPKPYKKGKYTLPVSHFMEAIDVYDPDMIVANSMNCTFFLENEAIGLLYPHGFGSLIQQKDIPGLTVWDETIYQEFKYQI